MYFGVQIVPDLTSGWHFLLVSVSCWHVPINFLVFSYFLAQDVPGLTCPFPALAFLQEGLALSRGIMVSKKASEIWVWPHLQLLRFLHCLACSATYPPRVPKVPCSSILLHSLCPLSGGPNHHFSVWLILTPFHSYSSVNWHVVFSDHLRIPPWPVLLAAWTLWPLSHGRKVPSHCFCFVFK